MVDDLSGVETRPPVGQAVAPTRQAFLRRTYGHLLVSAVAFVALEVWYFRSGFAEAFLDVVIAGDWQWMLFIGGFIVAGWSARAVARGVRSLASEYVGLAAYVVVESLFFAPMIAVAELYGPGTIRSAGLLTVLGFVGLSVIAFRSSKDFSLSRGLLQWGAVLALMAIVGALLFGVVLGTWFSLIMIGLAGAGILCDTSTVIHHFPADKHVAAALELFASSTLMLWYMLSSSE